MPKPFESRVGPDDFVVETPRKQFLRADRRGRWITLLPGRPGFLHRTLDGRVVRRDKHSAVDLSPEEAARTHREAATLAGDLADLLPTLADEDVHLGGTGDREALLGGLAAVQGWTPERHDAEAELYRAAYAEAVPVLPPDRYADIVVLPAVGCANRSCTFCTLHRDRPFRALTEEEFAAHLVAVVELLGPLARRRDGVFLGSASALTLSNPRLRAVFDLVEASFGRRKRGIGCFFDPDLSPRRGVPEWQELADAGVARAVLGLESGLPSLRQGLHKSGDVDRVVRIAREMGEGGVARGVTVLVGAGGADAVEAHRAHTAAAIGAMHLTRADLVYLSPLVGALPEARLDEETAALKSTLRGVTDARVVPYRLELFRHYA